MIYLTAYGYSTGNPNNIFRPYDGTYICGTSTATLAFPYMYFKNPMDLTMRVCVASCPSIPAGQGPSVTSWPYYGGSINFDAEIDAAGTVTGSYSASSIIGYDSYLAAGRVCVPSASVVSSSFSSVISSFSSAIQQGDLANFILDVRNWLLASFGFAILISLLFMFLLKCLAGCIVWLSIFGVIIVFAGAGVIFLYNAGKIPALGSYSGYLNINSSSTSQQNYDVYGYICFGLSGFFFILMLCCCNRLRLAVAVCKAAGQFVVGVCLIVLVPIFQTVITLGFWGACLVVMVFLVSSASFVVVNPTDYFTSIASYSDSNLIRLYIFIFTTLWGNALIQAIGTFVIASACVMWYYSHGPGQTLDFPIFRSYKMAFRFHFGSLAFGSLIVAIVQFLQLIVEVFKKQAESTGADQNKCLEYAVNCLRCCLACVERIVQFLNKTAYIQIAIRGKNFCMAAKDGFELVWSNGLRYAIVSGVGEIMMFIGKLCIAASTAGAFYLLILYYPGARSNVLQPIYLLIIVFIMAYAVATLFMSVYSLAMDTLLACFIVDETNQKAKGNKAPLFAPP